MAQRFLQKYSNRGPQTENQPLVAGGKGRLVGEFGWTCPHCCIENGSATRPCCRAQGTSFNVRWRPGLESGEDGCVCVYS